MQKTKCYVRDKIKLRIEMYSAIRDFFVKKNVLEVETPILAKTTSSNPHISPVLTDSGYLQTSPEYMMKRLLCSGSGSIFQICKSFRKEEIGPLHRVEFSMLEWYREGFTHHMLIDEICDFFEIVARTEKPIICTYQQLFLDYTGLCPYTDYEKILAYVYSEFDYKTEDIDEALGVILSLKIISEIKWEVPLIVYDYPPSQAELSKVIDNKAARFEVFWKGMELANGYFELTDHDEQSKRYKQDIIDRQMLGLDIIPKDSELLDNMKKKGLPLCSGVALGLDRLLMGMHNLNDIKEVLAIN